MNCFKRFLFIFGVMFLATNISLGTEVFAAYYDNDITPPWGRIYVEKSAEVDGTTYVGETPVTVKIYAKDDFCTDAEIKYYISTSPISNTSKLDTWYDYEEGASHEITLNENGTGNVYTIFKDANGNTSLTYEVNANTSQTVIFDSNGGEAIPTEVNTSRTYGMPYILPVQEPYKRGEYFLGWSTDKNANVGSYRQGDAIPPDASLGTADEVTLYAIYGTDLTKMPDLIDVVEIGDYVNYPVEYENVVSWEDSEGVSHEEHKSKLNGWRVMSIDDDTGTILLVSAGVPLTLYNSVDATAVSTAEKLTSTSEFLNISFTTAQTDGKFRKNGFAEYTSLINTFTNKYTVINSDIPEVRSITKADLDALYQYFGGNGETEYVTYVDDVNYKELLAIPSTTQEYWAYYWLATAYDDEALWGVIGYNGNALAYSSGHEIGVRPVVTLKPNIKATGKDLDGAWNIEVEEKVVQKPVVNKVTYTGNERNVSLNYDSRYIEISGTTKATDPGIYTAIASLKEPEKYTWADGSTEDKEIPWEIVSEIYVTLYTDGTLGFSNNTDTIEGKTVSKSYGNVSKVNYTAGTSVPWNSDISSVKSVNFVNKIIPPIKTSYWFNEGANISNIYNISNLDTSMVTDMQFMFRGCTSLKSIDVSGFDTRNVTNMRWMFANCTSLTSLDVSGLETDSVTDMEVMFGHNPNLKNITFGNFDASKVTNFYAMFFEDKALTTLDLSSFNTSSASNMTLMFWYCENLKTIYVGDGWKTSQANVADMFTKCGTQSVTKK